MPWGVKYSTISNRPVVNIPRLKFDNIIEIREVQKSLTEAVWTCEEMRQRLCGKTKTGDGTADLGEEE